MNQWLVYDWLVFLACCYDLSSFVWIFMLNRICNNVLQVWVSTLRTKCQLLNRKVNISFGPKSCRSALDQNSRRYKFEILWSWSQAQPGCCPIVVLLFWELSTSLVVQSLLGLCFCSCSHGSRLDDVFAYACWWWMWQMFKTHDMVNSG
jgi:hypothetical protein